MNDKPNNGERKATFTEAVDELAATANETAKNYPGDTRYPDGRSRFSKKHTGVPQVDVSDQSVADQPVIVVPKGFTR